MREFPARWLTGSLSAVLENAPTYITFLAAAMGHHLSIGDSADVVRFVAVHTALITLISLSSVFFGALTYIGNGPNLMVKTIVEHARVAAPSLFGFLLKCSLPIMTPILAPVAWIYSRGEAGSKPGPRRYRGCAFLATGGRGGCFSTRTRSSTGERSL